MNTTRTCPECGKPVAPNGLRGLCPECMMKVGLAAQTGEVGPGGTSGVPPRTKPPPTPAEVAALFPQLEILECLGCGGMGAVYKARQPRLDRLVALKILTCDREDATREARFAERFEREARALAKLSHPHIVAMYEFGQVEGLPYFIMEYVDGLNVRQLEQARKLTPREALQIIPQICEALQFAHDEGIVHRDIKPANILVDRKGRVKIADFGIAKIMGGTPLSASDAEKLAPKPSEGLTQEQILGTPHYMAPEQVEHPQAVDHRADIYSLGVVFYEMLTGELPVGKFQPPSRKVQIDVRLDEIVLHALEKEPERRYQQVSQVKSAVETIMTGSRPEADFSPTAEALSLGFGTWSWLQAARWSARLLGLSLLLFVAVMVGLLLFGVGLPPLGLQSAGTLLNYLAIALLILGFILGWKFEGTAAVLIAAGWALWHLSNGSLSWSMFHIALLVATLYAFCWWATRGQRTLVLVGSRNGRRAVNWSDVLGSLWGLAGLVLLVGRKVARTEPLMYSFFDVGGWYYPSSYHLLVAVCFGFALACLVIPRLNRRTREGESTGLPQTVSTVTPGDEALAAARSQLKVPALGVFAAGCLDLAVMAGVVLKSILAAAAEAPDRAMTFSLIPPLLAMLFITGVIIAGARLMGRLANHALAVTASVLAILLPPGTVVGLPFGIWSIVLLYRTDVRAAFVEVARKAASERAATLSTTDSASVPRAGVALRIVSAVAAVVLLVIVVALLADYWPFQARQKQVSAGAVVRTEEKLRTEIQRRLHEGGWKADFSVAVSPDLKRAECRLAQFYKNGMTEYPPPHAAIRIERGGDSLWLVRGEGEFQVLRFSVDTSAEGLAQQTGLLTLTAAASFGLMREVTLNDMDDLRGGEALDLDSGKLLDLPEDIKKRPENEQSQWLKDHGSDVMLDHVKGRWGLLTSTANALKLAPLANEQWESATERDLSQALAAEPSGLEMRKLRSWTVYVLPTNDQPPLTFAFHTVSGVRGVLQITGFEEEPNCARLRYKVLPTSSSVRASPREVVAEWLQRVKVGTREAWDLTTRSSDVGWGPSFTGLWEYDRIRPLHQLGGEEQAMVLSNPFKDNAGQRRVFCAVLRKRDGRWLVDRHECISPSDALSLMKGFAVNPGMKFDVLAEELVGEWGAACDSTISLAADGTGAQLRVGPGGPDAGAKPESFQWEISGSTLRRQFAHRDEKLEILWMDDQGVQFRSPNESEWDAWFRTPQGDSSAPKGSAPNQWKNSKPLTGDQP